MALVALRIGHKFNVSWMVPMMGWRERAPQQVAAAAAAVAATSRSNTTTHTAHCTGSPLVGYSSVSHRTNTKATAAAASRSRRAELPGTA